MKNGIFYIMNISKLKDRFFFPFLNFVHHMYLVTRYHKNIFRKPFPDRKPTVSWTWENAKSTVSTTTVSDVTTSKFYFPSNSQKTSTSSSTTTSDKTTEVIKGPTRPTRPPKPSSIDLVTYFPPQLSKPSPGGLISLTPTTTTTTTTTTRRTTPRPTRRTTRRTTRKTTPRTTTTRRTTTRRTTISTTVKPNKRPQQPRGGGCGLPQKSASCPKGRIVNGTQSCYGQFPWQVRKKDFRRTLNLFPPPIQFEI